MNLFDLTNSSRKIMRELFELDRPVTVKDLREKLPLSPRSISLGLRKLSKRNIVKKVPNLRDMRQPLYFIPKNVRTRIEKWLRFL